jgi:hypothetical protein
MEYYMFNADDYYEVSNGKRTVFVDGDMLSQAFSRNLSQRLQECVVTSPSDTMAKVLALATKEAINALCESAMAECAANPFAVTVVPRGVRVHYLREG